mmetsp:Transcript_9659/g.40452  ORF Transcript_9659/g.40452 Transcript_9659/m.40452 type:complete len:227 (-) Transcript_9659:1415-2095(-)
MDRQTSLGSIEETSRSNVLLVTRAEPASAISAPAASASFSRSGAGSSRRSAGLYAWNASAGSRPCTCTRSVMYGTTLVYSSTSGNAVSRNWQNNANVSWHPSCNDAINLRCAASAPSRIKPPPSNATALLLCAVSTNRGTVRGSPPGAPRCSASFKRAMPLAFARAGTNRGPPAETASARKIGPPAMASICASDKSSKVSEPVARAIISRNTKRSMVWSSRNAHTR